jgi:hypothetical protein
VTNSNLFDAIRGPVMLIALGILLAADQLDRMGIDRTWPALLILFGILKLAAYAASRQPSEHPLYPPQGGPQQ